MGSEDEDGDLNPPRRVVIEDVTVRGPRCAALCCMRCWYALYAAMCGGAPSATACGQLAHLPRCVQDSEGRKLKALPAPANGKKAEQEAEDSEEEGSEDEDDDDDEEEEDDEDGEGGWARVRVPWCGWLDARTAEPSC